MDGYTFTGNNVSNGNTIFISGAGGGGGGGASSGGTITFVPNNPQWITVTIPNTCVPQTIGIDLAVPVEKKKKDSAGCFCKKCKDFFEYAEPNQEDGTLVCWSCRHGY
jgi:hypothetical protein